VRVCMCASYYFIITYQLQSQVKSTIFLSSEILPAVSIDINDFRDVTFCGFILPKRRRVTDSRPYDGNI
jgi:hypothetical protein